MTAEHSYTALRAYERCVAGMLADPDVGGDLLLVGIWLARATILRVPAYGEGRWSLHAIARDVFGPTGPGGMDTATIAGQEVQVPHHHVYKVREALRDDVPRYDPWVDNGGRHTPIVCEAPMIRRTSKCGRAASVWGFETDPATGRRVPLGACRRHHDWYRQQRAEHRATLEAAGDTVPTPAANTGGALARHIRVDWSRFWRALRPDWTPPPDDAATRKPTLTVHVNAESEPDQAATRSSGRPYLTTIRGGWQ